MAASQKSTSSSSSSTEKSQTINFEVFGKVQGVFFRKHTHKEAVKLGLKGWVMNTECGTVVGTIQGPPEKVTQMKTWLQKKGSPKSRIDKCVFSGGKEESFSSFDIRK